MSARTEYLRTAIAGILSQVNRDAARAEVDRVCGLALRRLAAREELGQDPDQSELPAFYASINSAVQAFNEQAVTVPTQAELLSDLNALPTVDQA